MRKLFYNVPIVPKSVNKWDLLFLLFIFLVIFVISSVCSNLGGNIDYNNINMLTKYEHLSTNLWKLPIYIANTIVRILIALLISLVFSIIIGTLAAKKRKAESVIIPIIDVLQSIPILGFLTISVAGFISIFPHSLWGAQIAIIFSLFTAQVWNMTLSLYQSLKTLPKELSDVADIYHLSLWQKLWRIEIPYALPGLIWNIMMSVSASWFMVVASETIVINISKQTSAIINLPGIGTFISQANLEKNYTAIFMAVVAILATIVIYDKIIFKPLLTWSKKFTNNEIEHKNIKNGWCDKILQRSKLFNGLKSHISHCCNAIIDLPVLKKDLTNNKKNKPSQIKEKYTAFKKVFKAIYIFTIFTIFTLSLWYFTYYKSTIAMDEIVKIFLLTLVTGARVFTLIIISSIIWVPIGVWIGTKPNIAEKSQTYVQIFASFPVNIIYGVFATLIIKLNLNFDIWCIFLMSLGTQWYILFNVIAGASAIPYELKMVSENMQLRGLVKWFKFLLPAIMPFYITGAITAAGGAWNASIICEYIQWGDNAVTTASGIGSYIAGKYYAPEDNSEDIIIGVMIMCVIVILTNKFFWRKLYDYTNKKFGMNI